MKITHKIDEFLAELFPQYKKTTSDLEVLKLEIAKYYSYGPYKPSVSINGDLLTIYSIPRQTVFPLSNISLVLCKLVIGNA